MLVRVERQFFLYYGYYNGCGRKRSDDGGGMCYAVWVSDVRRYSFIFSVLSLFLLCFLIEVDLREEWKGEKSGN